MKKVSNVIAVLSLSLFATVAVAGNDVPRETVDESRNSIVSSAYQNLQDLMPFLFTTGIAVLQGKLQPKGEETNQAIVFALTHAAILIPSAVAASNAYSRVATIRDTRKNFDAGDIENQNALTRQQDQILANYGITIPLSIIAAMRLATSNDATARIAYIVGAYLLAAGANSPFDYLKGYISSTLDSMRLQKTKANS